MNEVSNSFHRWFSVELAETPDQIQEVYRLRYDVYCLDRGFEDAAEFPDGLEHDAFDEHSVHGLIRHTRSGKAIAGVRLVLAQAPHERAPFPMEGMCLEALTPTGRHVLRGTPRARVAELSRFAVSREFRRRLGEAETISGASDRISYIDQAGGHRNLPFITLGLFAAIVRLSEVHGITHWMAVMEPALVRLLQRFGIRFRYVGHLVNYHGRRKPVFDEAAHVLEGIRQDRPDVWGFITDEGRYQVGHDSRARKSGGRSGETGR